MTDTQDDMELVKQLDEAWADSKSSGRELLRPAARRIEALVGEAGRWRKNAADATAQVIMDTDRLMADADRRVEEVAKALRELLYCVEASEADGIGVSRLVAAKNNARAVLTHLRAQNEDGLTAPATGRSPISQEGSIAPEALSEAMLVAAYKRGFEWCIENNADREYVGKAALDYADKVLSASPTPPVTAVEPTGAGASLSDGGE